ncbi:MAG: radical SAM protein [Endomicrobiales bacterium]|nr:radical SAM protein [Endomicrobiales bacterium]
MRNKIMSIVYPYKGNLYINLTNRCNMACPYCIKYKWKGRFRSHNLRLSREPSAGLVINEIQKRKNPGEIVFCGYGEPLIRLNELVKIARWAKMNGLTTRINTSGTANAYHKRNILPELKGLIDAVSVSLNGSSEREFKTLNRPKSGIKAFRHVIDFIKESRKYISKVTVTSVALPGLDTSKCRRIAEKLKVRFKLRPYLDEYENK